jgi:hypothetical protein
MLFSGSLDWSIQQFLKFNSYFPLRAHFFSAVSQPSSESTGRDRFLPNCWAPNIGYDRNTTRHHSSYFLKSRVICGRILVARLTYFVDASAGEVELVPCLCQKALLIPPAFQIWDGLFSRVQGHPYRIQLLHFDTFRASKPAI